MQQSTTLRFYLEEKEIREALYDYFVRKLKANNINATFSAEVIDLGEEAPYATLEIRQNEELE
jgi:hypothetical protein